MSDSEISYTDRLRNCYEHLLNSRVVNKREFDQDALEYFEKFCNSAIPVNDHEIELRDTVRNMYYNNKLSFIRCITQNPYLIFLTEARAIVVHFKVQDLIYINWNGKYYTVQKNDFNPNDFAPVKKNKFRPHETQPNYRNIVPERKTQQSFNKEENYNSRRPISRAPRKVVTGMRSSVGAVRSSAVVVRTDGRLAPKNSYVKKVYAANNEARTHVREIRQRSGNDTKSDKGEESEKGTRESSNEHVDEQVVEKSGKMVEKSEKMVEKSEKVVEKVRQTTENKQDKQDKQDEKNTVMDENPVRDIVTEQKNIKRWSEEDE